MTLLQSIAVAGTPSSYRVSQAAGINLDRIDLFSEDDAEITVTINTQLWFRVNIKAGNLLEVLEGDGMSLAANETMTFTTDGTTIASLKYRIGGQVIGK